MPLRQSAEGKVRENGEKGEAAARTKKARKLDEGPTGEVTLITEASATLFGKRKPSFWKEKMGAKRRCHAPVASSGSVHHVGAGVGEEGRGRAQKGGGSGI